MDNYKELLDIGIFYIQNGKYDEAIEKITESLSKKSDWEIPYFYRGVAHQALEHFDDAILDYTKSIQINEKMCDAYYNRAKILLSRKDIDNPDIKRAVSDLEKALELDAKFIDALFAMAAAQMKLKNYKVSLEYLDKLLEIQPDSINARALKKLLLTKYLV